MGLITLFVLVIAMQQAPAQSGRLPQDPATLSFEVSPDHDAVDAHGPRVLKYLIDFSPIDGLGTAKTVDLGKPVPEAGVISVPLAPLNLAPGRYIAQVRVQGQGTTVVSGSVGPFQLGKPKQRKAEESASASPQARAASGHDDHEAPPADDGSTRGHKGGFWRRLYGLLVGQ
jgi:hypothetical protein